MTPKELRNTARHTGKDLLSFNALISSLKEKGDKWTGIIATQHGEYHISCNKFVKYGETKSISPIKAKAE